MAAGYDGSISIDTRVDSKGFNAGIAAMTNSVKGLAAAMGIALGVAGLAAFGKAAVGTAMEIENAFTGMESIVAGQGRSWEAAKQFIKDYISDGLVPVMNATTAYKNLASRGYSDAQIIQVMGALKNSAAFGRQASLTLGQAVQSATEGLKNENSILVDNAGVTKNVSMMWKDYAASIGTTVGALTKEQRIQAEVVGIMQETRFQMGDAGKLANSFSGQVSALGVSWMNLKAAVGSAIIPILAAIIPYIKAVIDWFVVLFNTVARVIALFFNVDVSMASTEASAGGVADATGAAADNTGDLAGNTKKAEKAAKGALAAFDEINVLQNDTANADPTGGGKPSGGGGGGTKPMTGGLTDAINNQIDELTAKVEAFKEKILAFFQPLEAPFARLGQAIMDLGGTIWDGLKWAWDNILVPLGTWLVQSAAPVFLDLITAAINLLNEGLKALQPLGQWLFDNFLKPLAEWSGQAILDALKWLTDRLNDLSKWIKANPGEFRTMTTIIAKFFLAWKAWDLASALVSLVASLIGVTGTLIGNTAAWIANTAAKLADKAETLAIIALYAGDFLRNIALAIARIASETAAWVASTVAKGANWVAQTAMNIAAGIWNGIAAVATVVTWAFGAAVAFLTSPIFLVVLAIVALIAIVYLLVTYWPQISAAAQVAWEWIVNIWNIAAAWFQANVITPLVSFFTAYWNLLYILANNAWALIKLVWNAVAGWFQTNVITPLVGFFTPFWETIKTLASTAWENIKGVWSVVSDWFSTNVIDPIKDAFGKGFDWIDEKIKAVLSGIEGFARGIANAVLSFIEKMLSNFTDGINFMVRNLNDVGAYVPDWINIPYAPKLSIPRLATGAVIPANSQFMAILGDQRSGRNLEAPENLIRQIVREESGQSSGGEITLRFEGTMGELIRVMKPYIVKETARVGSSLVQGGMA